MHDTDQQKAGADGHPADPPETTRVKTKHDLHVIAETVGAYMTHTDTQYTSEPNIKSEHLSHFFYVNWQGSCATNDAQNYTSHCIFITYSRCDSH